MKTGTLFLLCLVWLSAHSAYDRLSIRNKGNFLSGFLFSNQGYSNRSSDKQVSDKIISKKSSLAETGWISYGDKPVTVFINYKNSSVSVINPLAHKGVSVTVTGADVTVTSSTDKKDINFELSGTTGNGMFKIYSDKRFNLLLNGVNISNQEGPAIEIRSGNKSTVILVTGTENVMADGYKYSNPDPGGKGKKEKQEAAFFSEGKLVFSGEGSLTIIGKGEKKHAICSADRIEIVSGIIKVISAAKDGIHAKRGITISGGTIDVTANGNAINGTEGTIFISGGSISTTGFSDDTRGITGDSTIVISGGTIKIAVSGNQSKGIKCSKSMILHGGTININTSGGVILGASGLGYNPSYCTAIKGDGDIMINGSKIFINSSGTAGKGIYSDGSLTMTSGSVNITTTGDGAVYLNSYGIYDAYDATCLDAKGNMTITGGELITSSSGSAGKGISTAGSLTIGNENTALTVNITTTGAKFPVYGEYYASAKAIRSIGAVNINNGIISISSNDDGIKSDTSITISKATISISKSFEGIEAPYITINSGNINIVSSDDAFNASKGIGGKTNDKSYLHFNGGNINVNVINGDGLDSNGSVAINGGTIVVHGPQSDEEVGLDYNGKCIVSGGYVVISGTNLKTTQIPGASSSQYSLKIATNVNLSASTLFHIQDSQGRDLITFLPGRAFSSIIFSSPGLAKDSTYYLYTGGNSTGTNSYGLYKGGTYSNGILRKSFTINGKVTKVTF